MQATTEAAPPAASRTAVISSLEDVVTLAAQARLMRSPYLELHHVLCEFHEGILTLRGCVSCYHLKQVAQSAVRRLDGVAEIDNQLDVAPFPS
jgi:osmotically-inducible protein OsmY